MTPVKKHMEQVLKIPAELTKTFKNDGHLLVFF